MDFKRGGENPPDGSSAIKPWSRSHDQPNPKAFSWSVNSSLHILCPHPTPPLYSPHPPVRRCRNNTAVCVWPKVWEGRAERLRPWPPNNALTGEVQQGSTIIDGFSKNSASGSTPPQSSDLWPPINIPAIWQTQRDRRVGPPFSIQQCGVCSN